MANISIGNIFDSIEHTILGAIGTDLVVPEAVKDLVSEAEALGTEEITRLATIPTELLVKLAAPGADIAKAEQLRDALATAVATNLVDLVAVLRNQPE
jgi:hypothetical protein